jgi:DNA-binding MarR family transcriptional regulator
MSGTEPPSAQDHVSGLDAAAAVERAVIALRRGMSRRHLGRHALEQAAAFGVDVTMQDLLVVDAIEEGPTKDGHGVTIGLVADRGALDQSRASRVVANAVKAGLARRVASQDDARRVELELTDLGQDVAKAARTVRQAAFANAMRDWTANEREQFAQLLTRFTEAPIVKPDGNLD